MLDKVRPVENVQEWRKEMSTTILRVGQEVLGMLQSACDRVRSNRRRNCDRVTAMESHVRKAAYIIL